MKKNLLFAVTAALLCFNSFSQHNSYWKAIINSDALKLNSEKEFFSGSFKPAGYKLFTLDENTFRALIAQAPYEKNISVSKSNVIISIPVAEGKFEQFKIVEAPVMQPKLQAKHPEIRSYVGQSINNSKSTIRCDVTPLGFHATIMSANNPAVYINPVNNKMKLYAVYARDKNDKSGNVFKCNVDKYVTGIPEKETTSITNTNDGKLRTYRFAVTTGGEFSQLFLDGTETSDDERKAKVLAALVTDLVRINFIYETDFGVRLQYVDNEDTIIFLDKKTDPFQGNILGYLLGTWNREAQQTLDKYIGSVNYDVGHLLMGIPAGGNAGAIGSICNDATKGSGATGFVDDLTTDPFVVDYWAHEIGHQFGGNHTFDYSNEGTIAQMEPGSASTIMGYAGTTGQYDIQPHSDPYFHAVSIQQVANYIMIDKGATCAVITEMNNNTPVANAGADFIIPKSTPFKLTGSGSDADISDVSTYCWEQFDTYNKNGSSKFPVDTSTSGASFRTYIPILSGEKVFPEMNSILDGSNKNQWEVLSSVSRKLNFRFTVRDNHPGGGSNNSDDMLITVDGNSGPFKVTIPNTTDINWQGGSKQTVQWDVANTNSSPVNCNSVNILLSIDGGKTFTYTLASNTLNDGSEEIAVPVISESIINARIKIEAVQNVFFDISDKDFVVNGALPVSWLSFTAEKSGNQAALLKWSTANEFNNDHFEVERSTNGATFGSIDKIKAGINPNEVQQYSYIDKYISAGVNYYRIKQVDKDGKFTYSSIAKVIIDANGISVSVQPNPAKDNTRIIFSDASKVKSVIINNASGKVLYINNAAANSIINNKLELSLNNFSKGVYFIKVITETGTITQKLVVN